MAVEYPLPRWQSWMQRHLKQKKGEENKDIDRPRHEFSTQSLAADTFVVFVRLPEWSKNAASSRYPEIKTLRNLKSGIATFQLKAHLELSVGLPAHIINLFNIDGKLVPNNQHLVINENIKNGSTLKLQVAGDWEESIRAAWIGSLSHLRNQLSTFTERQSNSASKAWQEFANILENSGKENAFCALFVAASRGNVKVCKAVLQYDVDINQTTLFGNSSLHSASFQGHLEVIQLLVAHGADVRCRNAQGSSALDLAVASNFIDCARWLWLNQWSLNIINPSSPTRTSFELLNKSQNPSGLQPSQITASKPLKDCQTLFTKPTNAVFIPKADRLLYSPKAQSSMLQRPKLDDYNKLAKRYERPRSTLNITKVKSQHFSSKNALNNSTSLRKPTIKDGIDISKPNAKVGLLKNAETDLIPTFPSNTNLRPQTAIPKTIVSETSRPQTANVPKLLPELKSALSRENSIPSKYESRFLSEKYNKLCLESSNYNIKSLEVDITSSLHTEYWTVPQQKGKAVSPPTRNDSSAAKARAQTQNTASSSFVSAENKSKMSASSSKLEHFGSMSTTKKPQTYAEPSRLSQNLLGKNESLRSEGYRPVSVSGHERLQGGSTAADNSLKQDKDHQKMISSTSSSRQLGELKNPGSNHIPVTHDVHDTNKSIKKPSKPTHHVEKEADKSLPSREDQIRKERNAKAWENWIEAKKQERLAQKRAEALQHETAVKKWGKTFDQWLEAKRNEMKEKSGVIAELVSVNKPVVKRRVVNGKPFEDWLKEKDAYEEKNSKSDNSHLISEEERKNKEELREKKFAAWAKKKDELAKQEQLKIQAEEASKHHNDEKLYDDWKSKSTVMTFENWKQGKDKAKKLAIVDDAQHEALQRVESWVQQDRKERAEVEYNKWVLRKHSLSLQKAQQQLKEAKQLREKAEQKAKMKRAILQAKALLRWKKYSKSAPDIREMEESTKSLPKQQFRSAAMCARKTKSDGQSFNAELQSDHLENAKAHKERFNSQPSFKISMETKTINITDDTSSDQTSAQNSTRKISQETRANTKQTGTGISTNAKKKGKTSKFDDAKPRTSSWAVTRGGKTQQANKNTKIEHVQANTTQRKPKKKKSARAVNMKQDLSKDADLKTSIGSAKENTTLKEPASKHAPIKKHSRGDRILISDDEIKDDKNVTEVQSTKTLPCEDKKEKLNFLSPEQKLDDVNVKLISKTTQKMAVSAIEAALAELSISEEVSTVKPTEVHLSQHKSLMDSKDVNLLQNKASEEHLLMTQLSDDEVKKISIVTDEKNESDFMKINEKHEDLRRNQDALTKVGAYLQKKNGALESIQTKLNGKNVENMLTQNSAKTPDSYTNFSSPNTDKNTTIIDQFPMENGNNSLPVRKIRVKVPLVRMDEEDSVTVTDA
ncbi:uncharacterized protein LOC143464969 isoform X1 [Clavelina lepadiformis]|uniref:uncharacterized protein LOC143464969 isoform X1 n=1 Tax=Clavelina lepadiformis TaxID=159417 RepID=UPI00404112DC